MQEARHNTLNLNHIKSLSPKVEPKVLLSIIIPAWNAKDDLKRCLLCLSWQDFNPFEVIVVDNGSIDGTNEFLADLVENKDWHNRLKVVTLTTNEGFPRACNIGIKKARGEWMFFLNADCFLSVGFLKQLYKSSLNNPETQVFIPVVLKYADQAQRVDTLGLYLSSAFRFYDIGSGKKLSDVSKSIRPFGSCGCAAFINRKALDIVRDKHGYFDERFFFLGEDFELAWRLKKAGYKNRIVWDAVCYHKRSVSNHTNKTKRLLSFRNRYLIILKHARGLRLLKSLPFILFYDLSRFLYMLVLYGPWVVIKTLCGEVRVGYFTERSN